ncbi:MAG: hypothetical protein QM744_12160 [Mesorhizobium sp.]
MRFAISSAIVALLAAAFPSAAEQPDTRAAMILDRFHHANQWRDHIMVVGHRGGVREDGQVVRAENSLEAIEAAVALGCRGSGNRCPEDARRRLCGIA